MGITSIPTELRSSGPGDAASEEATWAWHPGDGLEGHHNPQVHEGLAGLAHRAEGLPYLSAWNSTSVAGPLGEAVPRASPAHI